MQDLKLELGQILFANLFLPDLKRRRGGLRFTTYQYVLCGLITAIKCRNLFGNIIWRRSILNSKYCRYISDTLLSATVFSNFATHHVYPCLIVYLIHNYFLSFLPLFPLPLLICLSLLYVPLWHFFFPLFFHLCYIFPSCHVSFIFLLLTNIPSTFRSAPVNPPLLNLLNPCTSSAANPLPPDVARFCGCEERCSDSEMCQSAES